MRKTLLFNGTILTQCAGVAVDSIAIDKGRIVAIGMGLEHDPQFRSWVKFDLKSKTVLPGFVDAHTHVYYWALSLGRVDLHGCKSMKECLSRIKSHARGLSKSDWVVGTGYQPDEFRPRVQPDRFMLDQASGGRPAFIFSKDEHTSWVNSRTLELAGITSKTPNPEGGRIERLNDNEPSGLLREGPAFAAVYRMIPRPGFQSTFRYWRQMLNVAWRKGVTGVHSFDSADGFQFMERLAEINKVGLRVSYYPRVEQLADLEKSRVHCGMGNEFFRMVGVKVFMDGALGSQTALCFRQYAGAKKNVGVEVTTKRMLAEYARRAARLGFPLAIHAIGDRAVASALDVLSRSPRLAHQRRHRIEHVQLIRRADLARLKKCNIVASMQPSHCASDVNLVRRYWPRDAANAYLFKSISDLGVPLAFGSDCPIEPLDPLAGIAAAVRRVPKGSNGRFFPKESLDTASAVHAFTAGPAIASGEENNRGYLLPGYTADLVILERNPLDVPPALLYDLRVRATLLGGVPVYADSSIKL